MKNKLHHTHSLKSKNTAIHLLQDNLFNKLNKLETQSSSNNRYQYLEHRLLNETPDVLTDLIGRAKSITAQKQQKLARTKKLIEINKGDTDTFLTGTGLAIENLRQEKQIEEKQLEVDYDPEELLRNLIKKNEFDDLAQLRRMIKIADQNLGGYQKQVNQTLQVVKQLRNNSNFSMGRYQSKGNLTEKKAASLARIRDPLYL